MSHILRIIISLENTYPSTLISIFRSAVIKLSSGKLSLNIGSEQEIFALAISDFSQQTQYLMS